MQISGAKRVGGTDQKKGAERLSRSEKDGHMQNGVTWLSREI